VDASDPTAMSTIATFGSRGSSSAVQAADGVAYLADGWGGISVVDLSDLADPREVGYVPPSGVWGEAIDIVLLDHRAAALVGWDEWSTDLLALDLPSPTALRSVGTLNVTPGGLYRFPMDGSGRYVVVGRRVVDIAEPTGPVVAGVFEEGTTMEDVAVDGSLAYVAAGQGGLFVYRLEPQ